MLFSNEILWFQWNSLTFPWLFTKFPDFSWDKVNSLTFSWLPWLGRHPETYLLWFHKVLICLLIRVSSDSIDIWMSAVGAKNGPKIGGKCSVFTTILKKITFKLLLLLDHSTISLENLHKGTFLECKKFERGGILIFFATYSTKTHQNEYFRYFWNFDELWIAKEWKIQKMRSHQNFSNLE